MTIVQIHKALRLVLDKNASGVDFGGCPAFLPQELDFFLNQAYLEVISNKVNGTVTQRDFESNSKRIADLQGLIDSITLTDPAINSNVITFDYSSEKLNIWLYVSAILSSGDIVNTCELVNHSVAQKFLQTSTNLPWIEVPVITMENNTFKVYADISITELETIPELKVTYLKYPTKIDSTNSTTDITEVPESVLHEVINRAAVLALENIESLRTQGKVQLNTLEE